MPTKPDTAFRTLVSTLAASFDTNYDIDPRDLPALTDAQLAVVVNEEDWVANDNFNPVYYAEVLDSAVYLTDLDKALAFWRVFNRSARESAADLLTEKVNAELAKYREPVDRLAEAGMRQADFV